jgi:hypothetical protein
MAADAQFAIDVAASMPAGEATIAELDELTAQLMGAGKNADHFQRAIQQVSTSLDAAKAATVAANDALADGSNEYRTLERAALQSAKAAEKAGRANDGVIPHELAAQAAKASLAVDHYAGELAQLEQAAKQAAAAETTLGRTFENVRKLNAHANTTLAQNSERLSKLQGALGAVGGPLGRLGQLTIAPAKSFTELSQSMGTMGAVSVIAAVGVAAVAAAILAAGVAAVVGVVKIAKWAVMLSDKFGNVQRQADRIESNFASLFSGLNVDPVTDALERIAELFDETTESGSTIKFLFESLFQPLIDQADKAAIVVEAFALGFLIGLLKLYIAAKPVIKAVAEFFGFDDPTTADTLEIITTAGQYAAGAFVALVAVLGVLTAVVLGVGAVIAGPFIAAFMAVPIVVNAVLGAIRGVVDYIKSISFVEMGADIMRGLASGITGAAGFVVDAVRNAINGAIKSAKALLGIASPSKVFGDLGENTGEGFAGGVEASAPAAQSAMADMVSPLAAQDAAAQRPTASATPAASSGASINLAGAVFTFHGVKDAEDAELRFSEMLTRVLEGDAAQIGGEAAPA